MADDWRDHYDTKVAEIVVDDDVDDPTYFCESRYGWRIPPDLWVRYAHARSVLEHVCDEIRRHERIPYPMPPPGSLARRMLDGYIATFQQATTMLDWIRVRPPDTGSLDDGSIDRLRRALEAK